MKPQYVVIAENQIAIFTRSSSTRIWALNVKANKNCNSLIHNNNLNDKIPVDMLD